MTNLFPDTKPNSLLQSLLDKCIPDKTILLDGRDNTEVLYQNHDHEVMWVKYKTELDKSGFSSYPAFIGAYKHFTVLRHDGVLK